MASDRRMISRDLLRSSVFYAVGAKYPPLEAAYAQLVFIALILLADDQGRGKRIYAMIRSEAVSSMPSAPGAISLEQVEDWMNDFAEMGAIELYAVAGDSYYRFPKWTYYQRGNWRPSESGIPPSPTETEIVTEELSGSLRANEPVSRARKEVKLKEEKLKEKKKEGGAPRTAKGADAPPALAADELQDLSKALVIINPKREGKPTAAEIKAWRQLRAVEHLHSKGPYSAAQIHEVLTWAANDDFWRSNVQALAPLTLRKPSGNVRKFDNLVAKYHEAGNRLRVTHPSYEREPERDPVVEQERRTRAAEVLETIKKAPRAAAKEELQ